MLHPPVAMVQYEQRIRRLSRRDSVFLAAASRLALSRVRRVQAARRTVYKVPDPL